MSSILPIILLACFLSGPQIVQTKDSRHFCSVEFNFGYDYAFSFVIDTYLQISCRCANCTEFKIMGPNGIVVSQKSDFPRSAPENVFDVSLPINASTKLGDYSAHIINVTLSNGSVAPDPYPYNFRIAHKPCDLKTARRCNADQYCVQSLGSPTNPCSSLKVEDCSLGPLMDQRKRPFTCTGDGVNYKSYCHALALAPAGQRPRFFSPPNEDCSIFPEGVPNLLTVEAEGQKFENLPLLSMVPVKLRNLTGPYKFTYHCPIASPGDPFSFATFINETNLGSATANFWGNCRRAGQAIELDVSKMWYYYYRYNTHLVSVGMLNLQRNFYQILLAGIDAQLSMKEFKHNGKQLLACYMTYMPINYIFDVKIELSFEGRVIKSGPLENLPLRKILEPQMNLKKLPEETEIGENLAGISVDLDQYNSGTFQCSVSVNLTRYSRLWAPRDEYSDSDSIIYHYTSS